MAQHTSIDDAAAFLWKTGLIGEINRVVLHPRGLALSVSVDDESQAVTFCGLIRTDDPEGMEFGPESLDDIRWKLKASGMLDPLPGREPGVGFVVQPFPPEEA